MLTSPPAGCPTLWNAPSAPIHTSIHTGPTTACSRSGGATCTPQQLVAQPWRPADTQANILLPADDGINPLLQSKLQSWFPAQHCRGRKPGKTCCRASASELFEEPCGSRLDLPARVQCNICGSPSPAAQRWARLHMQQRGAKKLPAHLHHSCQPASPGMTWQAWTLHTHPPFVCRPGSSQTGHRPVPDGACHTRRGTPCCLGEIP